MPDLSIKSGHQSAEGKPHILVFLSALHYWNKRSSFSVRAVACFIKDPTQAVVLSWSDSALIYSSIKIGIAAIILMNLLCLQRFSLQGIWPNLSDFLSNIPTPDICNYSNVTSVNCDSHLPNKIKIRSGALIRREERFKLKYKGSTLLLQIVGPMSLHLSVKTQSACICRC